MPAIDTDQPTIVGFQVPEPDREHGATVSVVAFLNCHPSDRLIVLFGQYVASIKGALGLADVHIRDGQIEFLGVIDDVRAFDDAVRALITRVGAVISAGRSVRASS